MTPLYRRLLGERFDQLPARVRELHDVADVSIWSGRADVERGRALASRVLATVLQLPPAGRDQDIRVTFTVTGDKERWERSFNGAVFHSIQDAQGELMRERVGPVTLRFALDAANAGLALRLRSVRVLGVPWPRLLQPAIATFETEREGRYRFEVEAGLPGIGLIVRYRGWLERAGQPAAARTQTRLKPQ